jgi:membrane AbrB-like protein
MRAALPLALCTAVVSLVLQVGHAPTPSLFGGLLAGAALALSGRVRSVPGPAVVRISQAAIGVTVGSYVRPATLRGIGAHLAPILVCCLATLVLSVLSGLLLARRRDIDAPTGAFSMIAGGASGLTAVARELGADERLVAVIQYLRVVLVVTTTPLAARLLFARGTAAPTHHASVLPPLASAGALVACVLVGLALADLVSLPAGSLLGPLACSAAASLAGLYYGGLVGTVTQAVAFAVIGAQIGLRFTPATLQVARSALPAALSLILVVMASCFGLGVLLARQAGASALDGYLATTPGGLYVVLATAASTHADVTFVVASQVLRLIVMLVSAPLLARWLAARGQSEESTPNTRS